MTRLRRNDAHGLLRIVCPLTECHSHGSEPLSALEEFIDPRRGITRKK